MEKTSIFDYSFAHNYELECPTMLSGGGEVPQWYYPSGTQRGGACGGGLTIKVMARDVPPWFACVDPGWTACERILSTPHPDRFCVVSGGEVYVIDSRNPQAFETGPEVMTTVQAIAERRAILFGSYTDLHLYGERGWHWSSGRLCLDCLKILAVGDGIIHGQGFDGARENVPFSVDIESGRILRSALGIA